MIDMTVVSKHLKKTPKEHELPLKKDEHLYFILAANLKADDAKNVHLIKGKEDDEGRLIKLVGKTLCGHEEPKERRGKNQTVKPRMDEIGARISAAKHQNKGEMNICGNCIARLYAQQDK